MAHSLRAEITHLFRKGKITRPEYDWFMKKAYGHDEKIKQQAYKDGLEKALQVVFTNRSAGYEQTYDELTKLITEEK